MAQTENQKKLLKILNEIFQLDQNDLDFGIYRIMNTKSQEINEFLDKDLLSSVASAFSSNDNSAVQKELDELIKTLTNAGINADDSPKVQGLKDSLSSSSTSLNLENEVFSHLANFFKRYYKDGDFVSLRRYKKDTYAIPYEGEEVKLHWANSDQYYIKSGEYFRDYAFTVNGKVIHLKLSDAETEQNNNKASSDKERRFVILESTPCEIIDNELYINFEYKAIGKEKQDKLNEKAITLAMDNVKDDAFITALNELSPTEKNKKRTIFEKHLKNYTSRNSFDYFIHKDLGGFLGRELDFYIKNEMLFLDDIMDSPIKYEEVMGKIKIFKEVSQKIIVFLTQLEELQKKLWEKKKFVIETNYCITLDKINEKYYQEILANKEQLAEWKVLFDVDVKSVEDLKEEKYLVLDTKFFDMKFKYPLLAEFDNLDEDIDGVLINSENFGALNLLQSRYKEQVKTVYIDPPYNTGGDGFLYNDAYRHSSWLSFMYDRFVPTKAILKKNGLISVQCDDNENANLKILMDNIFDNNILNNISVKMSEASGVKMNHAKGRFPKLKEYILLYKMPNFKSFVTVDKYQQKIWDEENNIFIENLSEEDRSKLIELEAKESNTQDDVIVANSILSRVNKKSLSTKIKELNFKNDKELNEWLFENSYRIIKTAGSASLSALVKSLDFVPKHDVAAATSKNGVLFFYITNFNRNTKQPRFQVIFADSNIFKNPCDFWQDIKTTGAIAEEGGVKLANGKKPEKILHRIIKMTTVKKDVVLDYHLGSGTTASVAHKMERQYIGIEMAEYFDTTAMIRMKNTLYGISGGIDSQRKGGFFKYFKLESYEDTLNNLEFKKTKEQQKALDLHPEAKEDYMLNYSLDVESQGSLLNIDCFASPFNYKLKIATSSVGETKDTDIDLVETFNYLLGLVVKRIELLKGYLVVEGQNLKKERILIIWRDGQNSDELNKFFKTMDWSVYDREFDTVYINGDNNLDNLRVDEDHFKVKLIEQEFKALMFGK